MKQPTDVDVRFLINLKLASLQREKLSTITYDQLVQTLTATRWAKGRPLHLNVIAKDISDLTVEDIVNYLTRQALVAKDELADYSEGLKGEN